jgi:D-alanyl-D-alanine carboxypeptidase
LIFTVLLFVTSSSIAVELEENLVSTDYYLSYDIENNSILHDKNINEPISPASITKLMTALLLYENSNLDDLVTISYPNDYSFEGKVAYLNKGSVVSAEQLMEFLLVFSANDAAYASAEYVSGSTNEFIKLMNLRANQLNMDNTNFKNPDGLDELDHYTTLNDLLSLSIYILENTKLIDITNKSKFYYDQDGEVKEYKNTNLLIDNGFIGMKTGWTSNAGLTFIGYNQGNNRNIITIVNKSFVDKDKQTHFQDTKILYDESINNFYMSTILNESTPIYKTINPLTDETFMALSSITKFGYKDIKTNIDLNKIIKNSISFSNNFDNELIEIQIMDSINSINYEFLKSNILFKIFSSN